MKIDTVVQDIYKLFEQKVAIKKEDAIEFGKQLGEMLVTRLSEERGKPYLRLSNLGTPCRRKLWYTLNSPELAEPLSAPTRIKFLLGDISELLVLFLAKLAGHSVTDEQKEVTLHGVSGRIDARMDGDVVDVKSASPYSFEKFKAGLTRETDAFGYLTQLGGYGRATGSQRRHFLALNKVLGHLHLDTHEEDNTDYEQLIRDVQYAVSLPSPPERQFEDVPDGKSGNRKLGTECSYCDFKDTCWPGLKVIPYANGPRYLTRVVREPNLR